MKKKWIFTLFSMLFLMVIVSSTLILNKKDDKPKVVVVLKELNSEYWNIIKAGADEGFRDFGIDGKVFATRYETAEEQDVILEKILKEKPDVLVVSPLFPSNISILNKFVELNIPVLLLDTDYPWKNKTAYIGTNNLVLGRKAGELLASQLQPGDEVAIIAGGGERVRGAKESLESAGVKIAAEKLDISSEEREIKKATKSILQQHPNIKGVIATTDIIAVNALKVLEENKITIPVIGADGIIDMIELIKQGTLSSTIAQNPYDMGYTSIHTALKVINGEKVNKKIDTGVDIIIEENATQKLDFLQKLLK